MKRVLLAGLLLFSCHQREKQCQKVIAAYDEALRGGQNPVQLAERAHALGQQLAQLSPDEAMKKPYDELGEATSQLETAARAVDADSHFVVDTLGDAGVNPESALQPLYALVGPCLKRTREQIGRGIDAGDVDIVGADCERVLFIYERTVYPEAGASLAEHVHTYAVALADAGLSDEMMKQQAQQLVTAVQALEPKLQAVKAPAKELFERAKAATEGMRNLSGQRIEVSKKSAALGAVCGAKK
jgi:hypothetical protein